MQLCMMSCLYIMQVWQGSSHWNCVSAVFAVMTVRSYKGHLACRQYVTCTLTDFVQVCLKWHKCDAHREEIISRTYAFIYRLHPAWQLQQNTSRLHASYFKSTRQNTAGTPPVSCDCRCSGCRQRHAPPTSPHCESLTKRHPGIGGEVFFLGVQCGSDGELDHKQAPF